MGIYAPQNKNVLGNLGNAFSSAVGGLKNLFGNKQQYPGIPGGGNAAQFYQVKPNDNSMADVAANLGHPLPDLISANNGIKTLPYPGSFIQLPQPQTLQPKINQGIQQYSQPAGPPVDTFNNPHLGRVFPNTTQPNAAYNKADYAGTLQQQIESGSLPATIPQNIQGQLTGAAGQPLSPTDLQNAGYNYNPITATWVLKGTGTPQQRTGAGGGVGNSDFMNTQYMRNNANTPFLQQTRWDPKAQKFVEIGDLIRQGKLDIHTGRFRRDAKSGGSGKKKKGSGQTRNRGTASTVLGLHLGGE